ncbi:MAG: glutathione S-transferase family protein [Dokdonella sp.]
MSLKLFMHPLASFCHKVLIALYENDTPFEPVIIDLGDAESRARLADIWPICQFPVLVDEARDRTVPETSIIIEYLAQHYPGRSHLIPSDADLARQTRLRDRFFDLHVQVPMQKIVGDRLRPAGKHDPFGVEQARASLNTALAMIDRDMQSKTWAMGDDFSMADCAATPALFYVNKVRPFAADFSNAAAYLDRLLARASVVRTLVEAQPYMHFFPEADLNPDVHILD